MIINMKSTKNNKSIKNQIESITAPDNLVISNTKWKYLVRSALKGKNILMVGPTGCGKTIVSMILAETLDKKFFKFNMGSTQDARSALIGNTHYDKSTGTIFNESTFVRAIQTPNSIILLDEVSRAHHDAWNILMTVLDPIQRYIRLDEKRESEVIRVAEGVTFIGTANIGNEYTATRVMDRALMNRFPVKIEMEPMSKNEELNFMIRKYKINTKDVVEFNTISSICDIAAHTREQVKLDDGRLTNFLSTRSVEEMAELITDGFSLEEIAEAAIYPEFSNDGGVESERTYVKQLVQKYVPDQSTSDPLTIDPLDPSNNTQPPF